MHSRWLLLPAASLSLFVTSCGSGGGGSTAGNPQGLGPFDSRGNYVEAWADSPSQWKKGSSQQIADAQPDRAASNDIPVTPEFVKVEEVPSNAVPYQQGGSTTVAYKKPTPTQVAKVSPRTTPTPTVAQTTPKTTTKSKPSTTVAKSTPKAKTTAKTTSKSSPKATAKAKPKSSSHTVKSGDNLYNIAKRYGTSVAAIQKANGTKGAMIRPGQSLVIPR